MYPPAPGADLTPEVARELDDTYLSSDPFAYFCSRISALAETVDRIELGSPRSQGAIGRQLHDYLQRPILDAPLDPAAVRSQAAADAFSLRHHVSEALCRLAAVALRRDMPLCVWSAVSTGPTRTSTLLEDLRELNRGDPEGRSLWRAVAPPSEADPADEDQVLAANVFGAWLGYATELLRPGDIDLQAAHNKVKHGLSVRARHDLRGTLTLGEPTPNGDMPMSAFDSSISVELFKHPVLEFLARAPASDGPKQGLEVTQLSLNIASLLAQAYMLAWTHAAMFSVLARRYFEGREEEFSSHLGPADYPGMPWGGPRPEHIVGKNELIGWRFPVTMPPGGGTPERPGGIAFRGTFLQMIVDWENVRRGRVTDG